MMSAYIMAIEHSNVLVSKSFGQVMYSVGTVQEVFTLLWLGH